MSRSLFNGAKIILIDEAYYMYSTPNAPSGRSPHSRSVQNVSKLPGVSDLMRQKYPDRIDPELQRAMDNFRKTMHSPSPIKRRQDLSMVGSIRQIFRLSCRQT